eukprot:4191438-Prymnesium_polylepis.1
MRFDTSSRSPLVPRGVAGELCDLGVAGELCSMKFFVAKVRVWQVASDSFVPGYSSSVRYRWPMAAYRMSMLSPEAVSGRYARPA